DLSLSIKSSFQIGVFAEVLGFDRREREKMAASVAGRSAIVRTLCRASTSSVRGRPLPSCSSNFIAHRTPILHPSPLRLVRRELSSFRPFHNVIASACLVSKLPSEASTSTEGRFSNYLSPI
ncbi:hypothetical protein O6P43_028488, partial [Quillaja saponaria]